jgi:hypothetical protein
MHSREIQDGESGLLASFHGNNQRLADHVLTFDGFLG